jgi:rubrerythrin
MTVEPERARPHPESEPVCLLHRVCPECGRLADEDPPTRCPACGAAISDD